VAFRRGKRERFCRWAIANIPQFPVSVIPDVASAFGVWQNLFTDYPNEVSKQIVVMISGWLEDLEDRLHPEKFKYDHGKWSELREVDLKELESSLRSLFLRSARTEQKLVKEYLARVSSRRRLREAVFEEIVMWAPLLSETHPQGLADLTIAALQAELPLDVAKRPEPGRRSFLTFSYHDWQALATRDSGAHYFPASPKREPFYSLFQNAPSEAHRLVRTLANHAITAWRQLFTLDWERRGTPLPISLEFPWGKQEFWGDKQVYVWARGCWAPHPIEAGLMALEHWAFGEVEKGKDVDEIIQQVVYGTILALCSALRSRSRSLLSVYLL
jgi:hypothetical protein